MYYSFFVFNRLHSLGYDVYINDVEIFHVSNMDNRLCDVQYEWA